MNWLTQTEINEAAKNIDTALDCSIKHWRQLATATFRELVWAAGNFAEDLVDTAYCAVCSDWATCPIDKYNNERCCGGTPWDKANDCWQDFVKVPTLPNYLKFHTVAQAEYRFLLKVRRWHKDKEAVVK